MRYELKKLFSSRLMLLSIIMTILLLGVFVYRTAKYNMDTAENISRSREFIADISSGRSNAEVRSYLSRRQTELSEQIASSGEQFPPELMNELFMCQSVQRKLDYIEKDFPEHRRALITDALAAAERERAKDAPDQSIITLNELAAEKYNTVIDLKLTESGKLGDLLINLDNIYWDYAMMLLAVITAVRMFTLDYSSGVYRVIHSEIKSRGRLFACQLAGAFAVTAAVVIVSAICQLIVGIFCFGISDLSLPLQQFEGFEYCPYKITVGGFLALKLCLKLLFYLCVTAVSVLMSVITKRAGAAAPISALAAIIPQIIMTVLFIYVAGENASALDRRYIAFDRLRTVLPQGFLNLKTYFFRFDHIMVPGFAVSRLFCAVTVTCLITAVCIFTASKKFARPAR